MELHIKEGGEPLAVTLSSSTVARLVGAGLLRASPQAGERWELTDAGKVGVAEAGAVRVWITPKLPIARLFFLLGYAKRIGWRPDELAEFGKAQDLLPALAYAFAGQTERALLPGLLHGYVPVDDAQPVLRGRLRSHEQLVRRFGLPVPLLVHYDDHRADIPENQLLKGAAERLLCLHGIDPSVAVRLRRVRHNLEEVSSPLLGRPLPAWLPTRLNARYHDALWLAELVLSHNSVDFAPGTVRLEGFLVDMAKVFEDFVTTALKAKLGTYGGRCASQDRRYLDLAGTVTMKPDLVWYQGGRPAAVVDAKYKAEHSSGFPNADLYQLLAYATTMGLQHAHLVYARGNEAEGVHTIRNTGITVHTHTLDLEAQPKALLAQVEELALLIAKLVDPPEHGPR